MTKVQSPLIGNALRTALDLDAAGGMPMDADTTIVPVALVADIRELLTNKFIPCNQAGLQTGVAAEYSHSALVWDPNTLPTASRIILDSILITASANSSVFFGFKAGSMPGTPFGLPRRKVGSLQSSNVTGRVVSDTVVDPPDVFIDAACGSLQVLASTTLRIQFSEPITLDAEGQGFVVGLSTANTVLRSYWEWREERA